MRKLVYLGIAFLIVLGVVVATGRAYLRPAVKNVNYRPTPQASSSGEPVSELVLTITSPKGGEVVPAPSIIVRGKTAPRAEVFIDELETTAGPDGDFSLSVALDEGENDLVVVANDSAGNFVERELVVTYAPRE